MTARIVAAYEEPEHYSPVCRATIPGGWAAIVEVNEGGRWRRLPKWTADDAAELVETLKAEFGRVVASPAIHAALGL